MHEEGDDRDEAARCETDEVIVSARDHWEALWFQASWLEASFPRSRTSRSTTGKTYIANEKLVNEPFLLVKGLAERHFVITGGAQSRFSWGK